MVYHRMIAWIYHHVIACYHVSWNGRYQRVIITITCDHMIIQCTLSYYDSLSLSSCDDITLYDSMSSHDHVLSCDDIDNTPSCIDNNGMGVLLCNNMIVYYYINIISCDAILSNYDILSSSYHVMIYHCHHLM